MADFIRALEASIICSFFNLYSLLLNHYQQKLEVVDYEQRGIFVSYLPCATNILTSK